MARRGATENRAELRQRMIEAAEGMIAEGGSQALTARALASRLDVAIGTTYNLFANLDELLFLVNQRTLSRLGLALAEVEGCDGDPEEMLMDYAERYIRFVEDNPQLWSAVFQMRQIELTTEAREQARGKIAELLRLIEQALAQLVADPELRHRSARSLWAAVHGILSMSGGGSPTLTGIDDVRATIGHLVHCHIQGLKAGS